MHDIDENLDFTDEYSALKQLFLSGVSGRLNRLWQLYEVIVNAECNSYYADVESLHIELHKLSGASGCYEFSKLESDTRKLESLVWSNLQEIKQDISRRIPIEEYYNGITVIEENYHALVGQVK